jgi:hypothetical protein
MPCIAPNSELIFNAACYMFVLQGLASVAAQPAAAVAVSTAAVAAAATGSATATAAQQPQHYYTGMTDCFTRTVQEQGIKGLYRYTIKRFCNCTFCASTYMLLYS